MLISRVMSEMDHAINMVPLTLDDTCLIKLQQS